MYVCVYVIVIVIIFKVFGVLGERGGRRDTKYQPLGWLVLDSVILRILLSDILGSILSEYP